MSTCEQTEYTVISLLITFSRFEEILTEKRGYEVTLEFLQETGFKKLILIEERGGLDLIVPDPDFTYDDVVKLLGNPTLPLGSCCADRHILSDQMTSQALYSR